MKLDNFAIISVDKFLEINEYGPDIRQQVDYYKKLRDENTPCEVCGHKPIWVAGSATCEWPGCFTCITGETDASEDFEVE